MPGQIVVFGNCQAETVGAAVSNCSMLAGSDVCYVASYNLTPEEVAEKLTPEVRDRCTLVLEQVTPLVRLDDQYSFPNARRVTFPSLDLNLLWPLRAEEKRAHPEPPKYPFGRFSYGDRVINEVLKRGLSGDEAWGWYEARSSEIMPDLGRFKEIERQRWAKMDSLVDIKMSDLIFGDLADSRLFWTYNHPSRDLLCKLAARILASIGAVGEGEDALPLARALLHWEFGENYQQPVHPLVAERLQLGWWTPDMKYRHEDREMGYQDWIRNQIAWT